MNKRIKINGIIGNCGSKEVFMGFAPASLLRAISFADVLNEHTGTGYQRVINNKHSLDFCNYIQKEESSTIPLTFNIRERNDNGWLLSKSRSGSATLIIKSGINNVLSQVDCQHRLGHLSNIDISLAFMCYIGLSQKEEMQIFNVINGKSKGLSGSLLDYHEAKLTDNLSKERPELFMALLLNNDANSPWFKKLKIGGQVTVGVKRVASLRTMQRGVKRFLKESLILKSCEPEEAYNILLNFWSSVKIVLENEWLNPRNHLITKGLGVYVFSSIAADIFKQCQEKGIESSKENVAVILSDFIHIFDWSTTGDFKGLGGEKGVNEALAIIRKSRKKISKAI
jgi:DNA sulfur modification protein DndB